jgi:hypothetical protein
MKAIRNQGKALIRFLREEDLLKVIIHSFRQDLTRSEKLIAYLFLIAAFLVPLLAEITNKIGHNYNTIDFLPWDVLLPGSALALFLCLKLRQSKPYIGSVIFYIFAAGMCSVALAGGATSIMSTPFEHNDLSHALLYFDRSLGFYQGLTMNKLTHFPRLTYWLQFSYYSITWQIAFTAILLAVLHCFKSAKLYILTILGCSLIAYIIYYFWPTFAPYYVIHNATFPKSAAHLVSRTTRIRAHLPYELYPTAGLIAFPSCHVVMALAGIFCWLSAVKEAKRVWIRCLILPISILSVLINVSLIAATVLLGYHYLTDALTSLVLFLIAWTCLSALVKKEDNK